MVDKYALLSTNLYLRGPESAIDLRPDGQSRLIRQADEMVVGRLDSCDFPIFPPPNSPISSSPLFRRDLLEGIFDIDATRFLGVFSHGIPDGGHQNDGQSNNLRPQIGGEGFKIPVAQYTQGR